MLRYYYNLHIAIEAVLANKFRSILTALGIIFGVAAVIAMLAIGSGAQREILEQIKLVGVNNIIITPIVKTQEDKEKDESASGKKEEKKSLGLSLEDARCIKLSIPTISLVSSEVSFETNILKDGIRKPTKLVGVTPEYFRIFNLNLQSGTFFNQTSIDNSSPVCIIGNNIKTKLFCQEDPINKTVKCGSVWFTVVGVLENRNVAKSSSENLGISEYDNNIYVPVSSALLRIKDRGRINTKDLQGSEKSLSGDSKQESGSENTNQLDKIIVQVTDAEKIGMTTEIITRLLKRRHFEMQDFEIKVPELLLKQQQRTKDIFNIVLGAIASISLLVGGIGIMNIMLASVMERTKEIGIRLALGATQKDVIFQFISEATMISLTGGLIGIIIGVALSQGISKITDITTIISPISILISFGVSVTVGIVFGYMPAKKAASQDPVTSLRYE